MSKKFMLCTALLFTALGSHSAVACDGHEHHQCKGHDCDHAKAEKESSSAVTDDNKSKN